MANINEIRPFSGSDESPWKPRGPIINRTALEKAVEPERLAEIFQAQANHDIAHSPITGHMPRKSLYQP